MSRGNVFKLSSNHILGGAGDNQNSDINDIKNSLKLLKAKKNQKQVSEGQGYGYGGYDNLGGAKSNCCSIVDYAPVKNDYNYDMLGKNYQKDYNMDYKNDYSKGTSSNSNYKAYGNAKDYGTKDYGTKDYGAKDYGTKDYGNKDYGTKDYGSKDYGSNQQYREDKTYGYANKPATYSQETNSRNARVRKPVEDKKYEQYNQYEEPPRKPINSKVGRTQPAKNTYDNYPTKSKPENEYYNQKQERGIKEVNRENQVDIVEYDPSEFRECRMGCGRKFNPESISKHEKNCKKVFQKKRKQFNAQQHRIVDQEQQKMMKKGERIQKKIESNKRNEKVPKWKAESMAFRAVMKQNRGGQVSGNDLAIIEQAENDARIQCKFCGRKFNEKAAPRHITFCE